MESVIFSLIILVIDLENLPTHKVFLPTPEHYKFFTNPFNFLIGFGAMKNLFIITVRNEFIWNEFICGADVLATKLRITHFYTFIQRKGQ